MQHIGMCVLIINETVCGSGWDLFFGAGDLALVGSFFTGFPKELILIFALCMIVPVLVNYYSARIKGWFGEWLVKRELAKLPGEYKQWHDIYLLDADGHTTQIDHLVASTYGIFVIETKNYQGWIFGREKQRTWTQSIYRKKSPFQNPLHQNARHIRVLAESTGMLKEQFHNVVYFIGDATLKRELPANVMTNGLRSYIEAESSEVFTAEQVEQFCEDVNRLDLSKERGIARRHVKSLKVRKAV